MVEENSHHGITLSVFTTQEDIRPEVPRQGGDNVWVEREAVVGPVMCGAYSSSSNNHAVLDVSNATDIGIDKFSILETLTCFEKGRVGTPKFVNLDHVVLPLRKALSSFTSNLHFMGGKMQSFMDFAVGADAEVTTGFRFRDAGVQVATSQRDLSPTNCCVAGCREIVWLVLLTNQRSLRLLQEKFIIFPSVPGRGEPRSTTPLPVAPDLAAPPVAGGGPVPETSASNTTKRAFILYAAYRRGEASPEGPRDVASGPQSRAGSGWG